MSSRISRYASALIACAGALTSIGGARTAVAAQVCASFADAANVSALSLAISVPELIQPFANAVGPSARLEIVESSYLRELFPEPLTPEHSEFCVRLFAEEYAGEMCVLTARDRIDDLAFDIPPAYQNRGLSRLLLGLALRLLGDVPTIRTVDLRRDNLEAVKTALAWAPDVETALRETAAMRIRIAHRYVLDPRTIDLTYNPHTGFPRYGFVARRLP